MLADTPPSEGCRSPACGNARRSRLVPFPHVRNARGFGRWCSFSDGSGWGKRPFPTRLTDINSRGCLTFDRYYWSVLDRHKQSIPAAESAVCSDRTDRNGDRRKPQIAPGDLPGHIRCARPDPAADTPNAGEPPGPDSVRSEGVHPPRSAITAAGIPDTPAPGVSLHLPWR